MNEDKTLTLKEIAATWQVCIKTVQREIAIQSVRPVGFTGNQPLWTEAQIQRMGRQRLKRKQEGFSDRIRAVRDSILSTAQLREVKGGAQ